MRKLNLKASKRLSCQTINQVLPLEPSMWCFTRRCCECFRWKLLLLLINVFICAQNQMLKKPEASTGVGIWWWFDKCCSHLAMLAEDMTSFGAATIPLSYAAYQLEGMMGKDKSAGVTGWQWWSWWKVPENDGGVKGPPHCEGFGLSTTDVRSNSSHCKTHCEKKTRHYSDGIHKCNYMQDLLWLSDDGELHNLRNLHISALASCVI